MQVFKTFMKVTKKRLHVSMIYIVIFIAIGFAMSSAGQDNAGFEDSKLGVTIIDQDNTKESKALTKYINEKHKLIDLKNNKDEIIDALYYSRTDYVLIISQGYSDKISKGETNNLFENYKLPNSYDAIFIETQLDEYVRVVSSYVAGGLSLDEATAKPAELSKDKLNVEIVNFSQDASELDDNKAIGYYYQYLPYIFISVLVNGLCVTLLIMRRKDVRNRTNCSCVSNTSQFMQIMLGTSIFVIGVYVLLTAVAFIIYGSDMLSKMGILAMINGFVFLIIAMMIALFVSMVIKNDKVVSMIANVVGLGMSFLCGVFVPQYFLSDSVLSIAKFLPAYWYVKANNMMFALSGEVFTMNKYWTYIGIQVGFVIALLCLTLLISRTNQKSKSI